jgi:pyridoxine kinase
LADHRFRQAIRFLTCTEPASVEETLASDDLARAMGPSTVLATSVEARPGGGHGRDARRGRRTAWLVSTPGLPFKANGSGDVTAALFTAHYVQTNDAALALERTASSAFDLIDLTYRSGERELRLVQTQDFYARPRMQFKAKQVR